MVEEMFGIEIKSVGAEQAAMAEQERFMERGEGDYESGPWMNDDPCLEEV